MYSRLISRRRRPDGQTATSHAAAPPRLTPSVCYIDAMILKVLATLVVLLATVQAPPSALSQTSVHPAAVKPKATVPSVTAPSGQSSTECNGGPCEEQRPPIQLNCPAPLPVVWSWHDRILWGAYILLALVGYAAVMIAVSTLKKIERRAAEAADAASSAPPATAIVADTGAADMAHAALLHAQSIVNAERPWILVTAEPTRGVESSFDITATNRGRSPATITSAFDQSIFAADEASLPASPEFKPAESKSRFVPIILLPGESATLKTFSREDAKALCASDEKFANIESWAERMFICGKVSYNDLITPAGKEAHETDWCCWYIHGKQRSALVPAGPAAYNAHT
jgi:hypothetical protein